MIRSFAPGVLVGLFSTACEKAPDGPREIYATIETKKVVAPESLFFVTIYEQSLNTLGGAGITGSDSTIEITGQAFNVPEGTQLIIIGDLMNASGTNDVF